MQRNHNHSPFAKCWLLLLTCAALSYGLATPSAARAQDTGIVDGNTFAYEIDNVPDLDQFRAAKWDPTLGPILGLPNNGAMYCVPTAAMNWVGYLANHGYPFFTPGPTDWGGSPPYNTSVYNLITFDDKMMGALMGTDPVNGTTSGYAGLQAYLDREYPGDFVAAECYCQDEFGPTYTNMALMAINGALVDAGMGFYDSKTYPGQLIRTGGHHVTLVGAHSPLITFGDIWINDPARDRTNLFSQSPFYTTIYNVQDVTAQYGYLDDDGDPVTSVRTQTQVLGYGNGILDNYLAVLPFYGVTAQQFQVTLHVPLQVFLPKRTPPAVVVTLPPTVKIRDIAIDPIGTRHPFLAEGSDAVWTLDAITHGVNEFARVLHPRHLCVGGAHHRFYVATDTAIVGLRDNGTQFSTCATPEPLDALMCDGTLRKVVGYASRSNSLYLFDEGLLLPAVQLPLPSPVTGSSDAPVEVDINPTLHTFVLHRDGSPSVLSVELVDGRLANVKRLTLQGVSYAQGISVDQWGRLYTSVLSLNGTPVMQVFDAAGNKIASPFNGQPGGSLVRLLKPFSNFDPATMHGPSFRNVVPASGPNGN